MTVNTHIVETLSDTSARCGQRTSKKDRNITSRCWAVLSGAARARQHVCEECRMTAATRIKG